MDQRLWGPQCGPKIYTFTENFLAYKISRKFDLRKTLAWKLMNFPKESRSQLNFGISSIKTFLWNVPQQTKAVKISNLEWSGMSLVIYGRISVDY